MEYLLDLSNTIDILPVILIPISLTIQNVQRRQMLLGYIVSYDHDWLNWERYLNALGSLCLWLKFLHYIRTFRLFGHLIKTVE